MKAVIIGVSASLVLIAIVAVVLLAFSDFNADRSNQTTVEAGDTLTACDLMTDETAVEVLGEGAVRAELPPGAEVSSDDVVVTNCVYQREDPDSLGTLTASILVRAAKNEQAIESNQFGFAANRDGEAFDGEFGGDEPIPTEPLDGLGDEAFYDDGFEQISVLVQGGRYWIIASADGGREVIEQLARLVVAKL